MQNRYAWDADDDDDDDDDDVDVDDDADADADADDVDDFPLVYAEQFHGFNRRLVLPPCLAQHAFHRLCPIVRSCIAPRGTPFPDLDPLWHKDCTLSDVSDENKNNTRVYYHIYILYILFIDINTHTHIYIYIYIWYLK